MKMETDNSDASKRESQGYTLPSLQEELEAGGATRLWMAAIERDLARQIIEAEILRSILCNENGLNAARYMYERARVEHS